MHHPPVLTTLTVTTPLVFSLLVPVLSSHSLEYNHKENSPYSMLEITTAQHRKPFTLIYCRQWEKRIFFHAVIIRETNLNMNVNEWMGPRDKSDSEQSFDWLVQCQSFVLHQWPSQTQEMGVSHCGGGASSWMVRGHRWSEIDAAPKRE